MKTMKLIVTVLTLLLVIGTFAGCSKFEYDNSTIVAQVKTIEGKKITLIVGEMTMDGNMMPGSNMKLSMGDGSFPTMPDGEFSGFPEGEMPEMPEGGMPQIPNDGSIPEMPDREIQKGFENGIKSSFTAGDESITLTLNEETVKTLFVGSIVQITFGDNGSVQSLTVLGKNIQSDFSNGNMTSPTSIPNGERTDKEVWGNSEDANS